VPAAKARRIAFLGGSFDPPHVAHVLLSAYVLSLGEVDEVLVAPVFEHAFGKQLAPFADRIKLCELAFEPIAHVAVSRIEEQLPRPNRTLFTLQRLQQQQPDSSFRLLVGSDVLADAKKWHAFDELTQLAPLLVVTRPGHARTGALVFPDVSSTRVRELLSRNDAAALAELAELVPRRVLEYAREHDLYRERQIQGSA
jgi:nicotinate-nucleotide adenylyltransferase